MTPHKDELAAGQGSSLGAVTRPLGTIFFIQALMTSAAYGISVIAPDAAGDLGLSPDSVGFLASTVYFLAMLTGLTSQSLIRRFGPTLTFQCLAALTAFGCLSLIAAGPLFAFLGAALIGLGTGPMNPTGSYVLSRVSPPAWQPLVFSLKQCATPAGGMLAGAVLPPLALAYDWRLALAILPAWAVIMILVAPAGRLETGPAEPGAAPAGAVLREILASLADAFASGPLRAVVLMGFLLGTCQLGIAAYYVVYLWSEAGLTPTAAGRVFVAFHVAGIVARIGLGSIAERFVPTRWLLPVLGLIMGIGTATASAFDEETSIGWIYLVTGILGASGNGWVGLYFAELARLAPGKTASVAGGAQFAMFVGIFAGPLLYGLMLKAGIGHGSCFTVFAGLALATTVMPLVARRR